MGKSAYKPKTYFIKTFGCQANTADSGAMAGVLEALGFEEAERAEDSDVFIVNTCSVRQKSEDKVYGIGKLMGKIEKKRPFTIIAGCMVGSVIGERKRYALRELIGKTPWADEYISPSQISTIPEILVKKSLIVDWVLQKYDPKKILARQASTTHAFVNISSGCDNFCTFCVVPYARGKETTRPKADILNEIEQLTTKGFRSFTLCGQNVNSWGLPASAKFEIRTGSRQKLPFAQLLREIHEIALVEKIDFISSNPFDFTRDLIETIQLPKISNYLHIAVQSGSNAVLKRMNRRHSVEEFIFLVEAIRKAKPSIELGTDIIVGFPGETRAEFMDTVKLFDKIKFDRAYISIYSSRKGTPAQRFFADDVSLVEKKKRHAELTRVWKGSLSK